MDEFDFSETNDSILKEKEENNLKNLPNKIKKSKDFINYAKSRLKYLSNCTMTQSSIIFMLESSNIKLGVANKSTQYQPNRFSTQIQTDPLFYLEKEVQNPSIDDKNKRFPSLLHFLKAASLTIHSIIENSQNSLIDTSNQPLVKLFRYSVKSSPIQVEISSNKVYALLEEKLLEGQLIIWNSKSNDIITYLNTSAILSKFCLYKNGEIIISGTNSGSIVIFDLNKLKNNNLSLNPIFTTDHLITQNHKAPIIGISISEKTGMNILCTLDNSSIVSFWFIRNENDKITLSKGETIKLPSSYYPSFSLAIPNNSVDSFLVGCGHDIWNRSRFDSIKSPDKYLNNCAIKNISFSPKFPQIFAASSNNGRVFIYNILEPEPLLELCIELSTSEVEICWSPTRASVLFVAASGSMRMSIFDFSLDIRKPISFFKIGSSSTSLSSCENLNGVNLVIAEGNSLVTTYLVKSNLSKPLNDEEFDKFKLFLFNSIK